MLRTRTSRRWRAIAGASRLVRGAQAVVAQATAFSRLGLSNQVVLLNGNLGVLSRRPDGRPFSVLGFTIAGGKIVEIDILANARLDNLICQSSRADASQFQSRIGGFSRAERNFGADGGQYADDETDHVRNVRAPSIATSRPVA